MNIIKWDGKDKKVVIAISYGKIEYFIMYTNDLYTYQAFEKSYGNTSINMQTLTCVNE